MARNTLGKTGLPFSLRNTIIKVGQQVRLARKRRGLTMQDLAGRMLVTRKTLNRLESGDPGVSIGILASALLALGLEDDLNRIADPETDSTGNILDREKHDKTQRVRQPQKINMDF